MKLPTGRQVIATIIVLFIIYAVLTNPTDSADVADSAWQNIKDGFGAVTTFFDELLK